MQYKTVLKKIIMTLIKNVLVLAIVLFAFSCQNGTEESIDEEYILFDDWWKQFEELRNLNRTSKFDDLTDGVQVPQSADTEQLQLYASNRSSYESTKDVTTFPPIPFNKQADYVDLILKATIKDAENRNINKIAIKTSQ